MKRVGVGTVAVLVILGVAFGAVAGAVVGAITVVATRSNQTIENIVTPAQSTASLTSAGHVNVPVTNVVGVVKRVGPAVVEIIHQLPNTTNSFGQIQSGGTAIGSGFVIDKGGDIVTNDHVIAGGNNSFTVIFANGRTAVASLVGANKANDIAVIKVDVPILAIAHFGDSAYLQPGEPVVAIGDALGQFQNTVTSGIVSGLHRNLPGVVSQDMIQTDAAINHGNSGGPLADLSGNVVGINTAIQRSTSTQNNQQCSVFDITCNSSSDPNATVAEGLGFAIPSNTAAPIAEHIIRHVPPAYLGVWYQAVTQAQEVQGVPAGARVDTGPSGQQAVAPNGPAQKAGLREGDIIVALGGVKLSNSVSLEQAVVTHNPGDVVSIRVWRPDRPGSHKGRYLAYTATLGTSTTQTQ
jgi:2-alkenal reductase